MTEQKLTIDDYTAARGAFAEYREEQPDPRNDPSRFALAHHAHLNGFAAGIAYERGSTSGGVLPAEQAIRDGFGTTAFGITGDPTGFAPGPDGFTGLSGIVGEAFIPPKSTIERAAEKLRAFAAGGVDPAVAADSGLTEPVWKIGDAVRYHDGTLGKVIDALGAGQFRVEWEDGNTSRETQGRGDVILAPTTAEKPERRLGDDKAWERPTNHHVFMGDSFEGDLTLRFGPDVKPETIAKSIPEQHQLDVVKALIPELGYLAYADAYALCSAVAGVVNSEDGRERMVVGFDDAGIVHLGGVVVTQSQYNAVRDDLLKQLAGQAR